MPHLSATHSLILAAWFLCSTVSASDPDSTTWSRFRGPNGTGRLEKCTVPIPWTDGDIRWKTDVPGQGNGSVVVWGDRFFLLSGEPNTAERYVLGGDMKSGKILWKQTYPSSTHPLHRFSSYASSTPCVDEHGLYAAWAEPDHLVVKAFTHEGQERWTRDLGRYVSQHGFGTSPIRVNDLLILCNYQDARELPAGVEPGEDHMVALDVASGEIRWSTRREATRVCYGVPCIFNDNKGRTLLLGANTGNGFFAIDAANGEEVWSHQAFTRRVCSSPVQVGDLIISTEGEGGGANTLVAISSDGSGKEAYRLKKSAPYVPTPVVLGDLVFLWSDKGVVSCMEGKSGNLLWSERTALGEVSSSPIILGDKLIGISQEGVVTILEAGREYSKIAEIFLGETCRSTPAATSDALLIRTLSQVICIGK